MRQASPRRGCGGVRLRQRGEAKATVRDDIETMFGLSTRHGPRLWPGTLSLTYDRGRQNCSGRDVRRCTSGRAPASETNPQIDAAG